VRDPLKIWRRDATHAPVAGAGTIDSGVAPGYGWNTITAVMRLPAGSGTLEIQQKLRTSSTWATTDTLSLAGPGAISGVANRTGELVRAVFTNGAAPQTPEILVGLT